MYAKKINEKKHAKISFIAYFTNSSVSLYSQNKHIHRTIYVPTHNIKQ
jgi:hypothetical protein